MKSMIKAAIEQTALMPVVLKTCGKNEEGFFQAKQP